MYRSDLRRLGWAAFMLAPLAATGSVALGNFALFLAAAALGAAGWFLLQKAPEGDPDPTPADVRPRARTGGALKAWGALIWVPGAVLVVVGALVAVSGYAFLNEALQGGVDASQARVAVTVGLCGLAGAGAGGVLCSLGIPMHVVGRGREKRRLASLLAA